MTIVFLVIALFQAATPVAQDAVPQGNVDAGKQPYTKHTCYYCHGTAGQGGVAGARIAAVARNAQSFIRYVRRPNGQMPAFTEKILSDQELTDIFAFVRSLPVAKAPSDIPLLRSMK
jgi:mono/diheme cytochrome c family protein